MGSRKSERDIVAVNWRIVTVELTAARQDEEEGVGGAPEAHLAQVTTPQPAHNLWMTGRGETEGN